MIDAPDLRVASGPAEAEHRVRGSRFIGLSRPASSLEHAFAARESERRRFHDATHHVFAVRTASGDARCDDDGEPPGTGGQPVLRAIEASGLCEVVVVVSRYFGGAKLGTGGLARAYYAAATKALAATPQRAMIRGRRVRIRVGYEDLGAVARLLGRCGALRLEHDYENGAALDVGLPVATVEAFMREVMNATAGRAHVVKLEGGMLLPFHT